MAGPRGSQRVQTRLLSVGCGRGFVLRGNLLTPRPTQSPHRAPFIDKLQTEDIPSSLLSRIDVMTKHSTVARAAWCTNLPETPVLGPRQGQGPSATAAVTEPLTRARPWLPTLTRDTGEGGRAASLRRVRARTRTRCVHRSAGRGRRRHERGRRHGPGEPWPPRARERQAAGERRREADAGADGVSGCV